MRHKIFILQILLTLFIGLSARSQEKLVPISFDAFYKAGEMKVEKGYYDIYCNNKRYYIEIPENKLGEDLFIGAQITKGYSSYVSDQTGIYHFQKGRNNQIDLYQNKSTTFSKDSLDYGMIQAIEKSGLVPVYKSFPIVAFGKKEKSFIIELTQELGGTSGIFLLGNSGPITAPDPTRSGLESYKATDTGIAFKGYATQSVFGQSSSKSGKDENIISAYEFEMVIQAVPKHYHKQKKNNPAYGFNTTQFVEYSTKNYRANVVEYVKRWNLSTGNKNNKAHKKGTMLTPENPIKIWIDPITPTPFIDCVKQALLQWEKVFEEAGLKNVFQIVNDETQSYKKINFFWGNAYMKIEHKVIENPATGEIIAARVNFMDTPAKDKLMNYLLLCGENDPEIMKDSNSLKQRKQFLTLELASVIGEILGIKANYPAVTAFSIAQLQDKDWLKKWGPSAAVVGASMPNYVAKKENNILPEYLLPKVSIYDRDAIAFLYGDRQEGPSLQSTYYAKDTILDPTAQASFVSNDLLVASEIGIQKLKNIYPKISTIVTDNNNSKSISDPMANLIAQCFSLYQFFVNQEAMYIGGQIQRPIIQGKNEFPVVFISKNRQLEVLKALEKNVFSGKVEWFDNPEYTKVYPKNRDQFSVDMAKNILTRMFKKEVLTSLIDAEKKDGKQAFVCDDLFSFVNRVVFLNFEASKEPTQMQKSIQVIMANILVELVNSNNITGGVNDVPAITQLYLLQVRDAVTKLLNDDKASDEIKNNCRLILLRFNRGYFSKTI